MARKSQQISRTLAPIHEQAQEQTQNNKYSTVDKVEEHAQRQTHVEQNVDTVRATIKQMEATLMYMAQSLYS